MQAAYCHVVQFSRDCCVRVRPFLFLFRQFAMQFRQLAFHLSVAFVALLSERVYLSFKTFKSLFNGAANAPVCGYGRNAKCDAGAAGDQHMMARLQTLSKSHKPRTEPSKDGWSIEFAPQFTNTLRNEQ